MFVVTVNMIVCMQMCACVCVCVCLLVCLLICKFVYLLMKLKSVGNDDINREGQ